MASAPVAEIQSMLDAHRGEPDPTDKVRPAADVKLTKAQGVMEREQEPAFDVAGFLELLGDSLRERLHDDEARTGVLTARIHISAGEPWAASVRFDDEGKRAASIAAARLASDVLRDRHGALVDGRHGQRVGANAVARDAAGGVGGIAASGKATGRPG